MVFQITKFSRQAQLDVCSTVISIFSLDLILLNTAEGTVYSVGITDRKDLNRQLVRSETCEIAIPELDLTLPPTSRGLLTTVEGLIRDVATDLTFGQPLRRIEDEARYTKIQEIIDKLKAIVGTEEDEDGESSIDQAKDAAPMPKFTIQLDDPAGNSFIEFVDSMADPDWSLKTYHRTLEQNIALGLVAPSDEALRISSISEDLQNIPFSEDEVFVFPGICSSCAHPIQTRMKKINIPYFKVRTIFIHWVV